MSGTDIWKALSSTSRIEILQELYRKPRTMKELSDMLDLGPSTVREHLNQLEKAGLVSSFRNRTETVGRPAYLYKVTKKSPVATYPKRMYEPLSGRLLEKMVETMGEKATKEALREIGLSIAEDLAERMKAEQQIDEWSLELFKEVFVEKYLEEMGAEPEVVSLNEDSLTFRENNCLVYELAIQHPELICDAFDDAIHSGICQMLNPSWHIQKVTCMGHGDKSCQLTIIKNATDDRS